MDKRQNAIMNTYKELGISEPNHVKRIRERMGLTQDELAKRCKISKGEVSMVENFQRIPNHTVIIRISRGVGLPVHKVFYMK